LSLKIVAYKTSIELAVKGANDLARLRDRIQDTSKAIDAANARIQAFSKNTEGVVRSVNNLNSIVSLAGKNFNEVALGTDEATFAARRYIDANRELNKGLRERANLIAKMKEGDRVAGLARAGIRERTQYRGPIGPGQASALERIPDFGMGRQAGQSAPVAEKIQRSIQAQQDELKLQKALERMELKKTDQINKQLNFRAKNLKMLNEEVAKGQIILKLREQRKVGSGFRDFSINAERFGAPSSPIMQGPQVSSAYQESFLEQKNRQRRLDRQLRVSTGRQRQEQRRNATSNALIGGAFPLLFGQGPAAAAGGALGGFGGGMMGGQFGFALSLIGTNVGAAVDTFVKGAADLGKALNPLTADIGLLTQAVGLVGTVEGQRLKLIESLSGKQAALAEATRLLSQQVGTAGTETLKIFGEKMQGVANEFNKLLTKLRVVLASLITETGLVDFLNILLKFVNQIDVNKLKSITQIFAGLSMSSPGSIIKGIQNLRKKQDSSGTNPSDSATGIDPLFKGQFESMNQERALLMDTINLGKIKAGVNKNVFEFMEKIKEVTKDLSEEDKKRLGIQKEQLTEGFKELEMLRTQAELFENIRQTIANGMVNAVDALIDKTKSLNDVLASVVKQIGRAFLSAGINALVGNISFGSNSGLGPNSAVNRSSALPLMRGADGAYFANGIKPFASGGMATRPTLGLVGEAGEDEYIIPASKMASSMQRYSSGARGEAVIPGTGSSYAGGGGSSTTVNYSGPILNFNSEEFVPKSAVGQIIATATARGASVGESRTISSLRNSRSRRSSLGL
jgi:hypothetical protein